ncbi:tryptophan synthase subunit alpha [Calidifontibacter sp. DB0510]|uniref:Tryptophan synthase alpha chain n=1 Tax=Metallococcus carri TaxID=1656884 RepID=A0A967EGE7_9MICO|nr:tryptophan synthase subunit alpha [Metallococcus carri]NHN54978.1 tryptophan synthase subunit alpha [Metallococcus carri]NOP37324.1 tryptophan synthase subunit alpha [Calidifontibacter sp. DB2511S]
MTAVADVLATAKAEGRAALIGYLPVGFPSVRDSIEAMLAMHDAGADAIEIGLPYSDPLIDGPIIQTAASKALAAGVRVADVIAASRELAAAGAPHVVMSYWNPVLRYGVDRFAADLAEAGCSGMITPDLVPDEAADWIEAARKHDLNRVFLVAPTSSPERIASTTAVTSGFVYAQSIMGVTGSRAVRGEEAKALVDRIREHTDLPIGVGIGVSNAQQAAEIAAFADAVIVGTLPVRQLVESETVADGIRRLREVIGELAEGVRR